MVRPLITGTRECVEKRSMIDCSKVRIITMSTMRVMTRATSSIGSPRLSWVWLEVRLITVPPICSMPASNETRVRVEFFSKIIASVRSCSGR